MSFVLELLGGGQPQIGPGLAAASVGGLEVDPVLDVGVRQVVQQLVRELVVVHQARESVLASVPEVPDERPLVEQLAVLLEEAVAEPIVQGRPRACPGLGQQPMLQ